MHAARMRRGRPWSRIFLHPLSLKTSLRPLLLKISLSAFRCLGQPAYTESVHLQVICSNTSLLSPVGPSASGYVLLGRRDGRTIGAQDQPPYGSREDHAHEHHPV